jgi:hypothetical protein
VIYLDPAFIGIGMVTALVWHTLIVDRRDGLILGALPISVRTTYVSKFLLSQLMSRSSASGCTRPPPVATAPAWDRSRAGERSAEPW